MPKLNSLGDLDDSILEGRDKSDALLARADEDDWLEEEQERTAIKAKREKVKNKRFGRPSDYTLARSY